LDKDGEKVAINALPGQYRWSVDRLEELLDPLVKKGLRSVLLFGVVTDDSVKDPQGSFATSQKNPVVRALKLLRQKYPSLLLVTDVCLCAYTNHGHCGIIKEDMTINNEPSIQRIAEMAVAHAVAGAHVVAPSDMMDGRIGAIKTELKRNQFGSTVSVMSYSAKFASCYYGPFREAAGSGMKFGDRSGYQLPPFSRNLALRAIDRDIEEGADMVMVKPGGPYLDIVRDCKERVNVPIAIYQVSGEYAMLYHAAAAGSFKLDEAVLESLVCMRRAGATILITYFAPLVLDLL
jgi:porphobilinogen synthase